MLLALDLGGKTGWALFTANGSLLYTGTVKVSAGEFPDAYGERMLYLGKWLWRFIRERGVTRIVFESPYVPITGFKSTSGKGPVFTQHSIRLGISWACTVELIAEQAGVPCGEVSAISAKKEFTGDHRAKKPDMLAEAIRRGWLLPDSRAEDQADACAVGLVDLVERGILPARPKVKKPPKPKPPRPAPLIELA